jgi:hypothetical protein
MQVYWISVHITLISKQYEALGTDKHRKSDIGTGRQQKMQLDTEENKEDDESIESDACDILDDQVVIYQA